MWMLLLDEALCGALQFIAAHTITNKDRKKHPELVERGFTQEWAKSIKEDSKDECFREEMLEIILKNEGILTNSSAECCLGARLFEGRPLDELNLAAEDLKIMLWHYGRGEGEDISNEDGAKKLLMMVGHDEVVARIVAKMSGAAFSIAQMERHFCKGDSFLDQDTYIFGNAKFVRGKAVYGVRPWVYDGKVKEDEPELDVETTLFVLRAHNLDDKSTSGRWAVLRSRTHSKP